MQFHSLAVLNWVVFEGGHTFKFTTTKDAPISVIFATNGAGKTTLLNAFVWGLYGEFTDDFEHGERLLNKHVFSELSNGDKAKLGVAIEFSHEGNLYTVSRNVVVIRQGNNQQISPPELRLHIKSEETGTTKSSYNPQDEINQVLSKDLKDFFFFTAERMKELTGRTNRRQVRDAIRSLLEIELLERACRHTRDARVRLTEELPKDTAGNQLVADLEKKIAEAESKVDEANVRRDELATQVAAAEAEVEDRRQALRELKDVADYQRERDSHERRILDIDAERQNLNAELRKRLAEHAFVPFIQGAFRQFDILYDEALKSGQFPPPVDLHLVERMLEERLCLCQEPLELGEARRENIERLRDRVATAEPTKDLLKDARREIDGVRKPDEVHERLRDIADHRAKLMEERQRLDARNSELSVFIGRRGEDAQAAEENFEKAKEKHKNLLERQGGAKKQCQDAVEHVKELRTELHKVKETRRTISIGERRVDLAREVEEFFGQAQDLRERLMRDELVDGVNRLYKQVIIKPYRVKISDGFDLDVEDESLYSTGISTAERAILSMCFVGALSSVATSEASAVMSERDRREGYAVLLDAPFSNIDLVYDDPLGDALTSFPGQLIIFVSPRWAPIIERVKDHVGEAYCLHLRGSGLQLPQDMDSPTFKWRDQPVCYITVDDKQEMISVDVIKLQGGGR